MRQKCHRIRLTLSHDTAFLMGWELKPQGVLNLRCLLKTLATEVSSSPLLLLLSICLLLSTPPKLDSPTHSQFCWLLTTVIYPRFGWPGSWNFHLASFDILPLLPIGNMIHCFEFQILSTNI